MKKLTIIALTLVFLSCEKEEDPNQIKFLPTAYSNGYTIQSKALSQTFVHDFVALPSLAQGSDQDNYQIELYLEKDLKTLLFKYGVAVRPSQDRNIKGGMQIYNYYVAYNSIVYYRIIRLADNKKTETRQINFNFK